MLFDRPVKSEVSEMIITSRGSIPAALGGTAGRVYCEGSILPYRKFTVIFRSEVYTTVPKTRISIIKDGFGSRARRIDGKAGLVKTFKSVKHYFYVTNLVISPILYLLCFV